MDTVITLHLREEFLKTDAIILESKLCDSNRAYFVQYDHEEDNSDLMIDVHRETGEVLMITIEGFTRETEYVIEVLRKYPLPWKFSLPAMKIMAKPLDEILHAIYEKYKNIKMEWDS